MKETTNCTMEAINSLKTARRYLLRVLENEKPDKDEKSGYQKVNKMVYCLDGLIYEVKRFGE